MKCLSYLPVFVLISYVLAVGADEYALDPNIYELSPSNFDKVIHKTNYTSIVKFYAPWCGYCQKLKPVWQKLGKLVHNDGKYAVNIAAVNCDKDYNKPLCAEYKITGYPSLVYFRPPKYDPDSKSKVYKHTVEVYNGERGLKSMYKYVTSGIKNYVKSFQNITSDKIGKWLSTTSEHKVLLIASSQQLSPLYKSLAIDFITGVSFGKATCKSKDVSKPVIKVGDKQIELPIDSAEDLPVLLAYDEENSLFIKYDRSEKLNDKLKISQWIVDTFGVAAHEGELSKKDIKYYSKYRAHKKVKKEKDIEHDEL